MRTVKNTQNEQDPGALEGQIQQPISNPVPDITGKDQSVGLPAPKVNPEDMPAQFVAPAAPSTVISDLPAPEPISKTDEILKRMYATREPAPVLDVQKQDRLRRMGNVNAIGRGVSLLSDALSLGLGGRVKRRAPDQMGPALYQNLQNMYDKNKNDQDQFNLRDVIRQRANIGTELQVQYKKDADRLSREKMILEAKIAAAKDATERTQWQLKYNQTEREIKQRADQHAEDMKLRYPVGGRAGANKANKPVSIMTSSGKKYQLPPEELSYLTNEATGNEAIASDPKFSNWFDKTETTKQVPNTRFGGFDKVPSGEYTYKLKPSADKHALAQSMLDLWEQGKISLPGRQDQPRNENGSTIPAWAPPKPGTVTGPAVGRWATQPSTNKKIPSFFQSKPDYSKMNYGNENAPKKPQPASTPKKQYSTGGYY